MRGVCVPGEIIVKLRAADTDEPGSTLAGDQLRIVNGLGVRRLHQIRPLMMDSNHAPARRRQQREHRLANMAPAQRRLLLRRLQARRPGRQPQAGRVYHIRIDAQDEAGMEEVLAALRRLPEVEYAERNWIVSACTEPNDPLYSSQWALAKIDAVRAWDTYRGTPNIVIAVPDTGVDYNHRDLQGNLWVNEAELNGLEGVDDDDNGYVDDVRGYDFISDDNDPIDDSGHGTHAAGIIAARTDNGLDVAGVCWNARIMPLKMLDDEGYGTSVEAVEAIYYAVANGADVISCSWGDTEHSRAMQDALAFAYSEGVVLVAAAGNESSDELFYPAAYPEVIGVAATDRNDRRQPASSFGDWVDVAAPGDSILSLRAAGTSAGAAWSAFATRLSGTSMAAPHVAGACALMLSARPFLSPEDLRRKILATGDPIAEGICASNRRLNLAAAAQAAVPWWGEVGFDRTAYPEGSDIVVHLADGHLRRAGVQTVTVTTDGGDSETVIVAETSLSSGVFSAVLASEPAPAAPGDGRLQALDGQWITVLYLDADNGQGRTNETVISQARIDYTPPVVLDVQVEARGTSAWATAATSEPTRVSVRYGRTGDEAAWLSVREFRFKGRHRVSLGPLLRGLDYGVVITLTDAAGNETVIDRNSLGQALRVRVDPNALLVPDVYPTIQAAIDAARPGDTVWVADGTYSGSGNRALDFAGKAIAVRSENGPDACIINGRRRDFAFVFRNGEGPHSVVDGFTLANGGRTDFGGGIQCLSGAPTIVNCILIGNSADRSGGGIYCSASSPTIQSCTFVDNTADEQGGGLYSEADSHPVVVDCTFTGNWAGAGGAAGSAEGGSLELRQCLLFDNSAPSDGAAVVTFGAAVTLANCTIARNEAGRAGGGLWSDAGGTVRLDNCILWDNTDAASPWQVEAAQIATDAGSVEVNYSCVQGWSGTFAGVGSFGLDPLFADPENGDFHLRSQGGRWDPRQALWIYDAATSPCVDAGDPALPLGDELLTMPDDPTAAEPLNTRINLGAYGGTAQASLAPRR